MTPIAHVAHMAGMGLLVAVLAPLGLRILLTVAPAVDRATPHPAVALGGFVVLHAAVTLGVGPDGDTLAVIALLVGAAVFWLPVLGVRHRLAPAGQVIYLFTAMPLLDLAGVWLVARGDNLGGLAMIVGMLPMAAFTVGITWRWIAAEERAATLEER